MFKKLLKYGVEVVCEEVEEIDDGVVYGEFHYLILFGTYYHIPPGTAKEVLTTLVDIVGSSVIMRNTVHEKAVTLNDDDITRLFEMCHTLRAVKDTRLIFGRSFIHRLLEYSIYHKSTPTCSYEKALRTVFWLNPAYDKYDAFKFYCANADDIDTILYQCQRAYSTYDISAKLSYDIKAPADFKPYTLQERFYKDLIDALFHADRFSSVVWHGSPLLLTLSIVSATYHTYNHYRSPYDFLNISQDEARLLIKALYRFYD